MPPHDDEQERPMLGNGYSSEPPALSDMALEAEADELMMPAHSASERARLWWRNAIISSLYIASWFAFATLLSMYNKWMFSPAYFNFPFPLFVTTMHMGTQFILSGTVRYFWPHIFNPPGRPTIPEYIQKCVPCAVTTGLDIGLSNLSLKTITLSLYTMCKSSSLVFVLVFAFLFRLERFSWRLVSVIFLITAGVLLMVFSTDSSSKPPQSNGNIPSIDVEDDTLLRLRYVARSMYDVSRRSLAKHLPRRFADTPVGVGIILVSAAAAFGGLRWALTQLLLTGGHGSAPSKSKQGHSPPKRTMGLNNPAATIFWLTPTMFLTLLTVAFFVEGPFPGALTRSGFFDSFWGGMKTLGFIFFPGGIAFAMVMSEYYIIQRTGIVPMSIAGIFKEVATIILATWFFGDSMALINWIGLLITFSGIIIFTHYKYQQSVHDSENDEFECQGDQSILLPPYSAVASEDSRPYGEDHYETSGNGYTDPTMHDSLGAYRDPSRSSLVFDAEREDEVGSRGRRPDFLDITSANHRPSELSRFSPDTPSESPSLDVRTPRSGKRKDLRVRFDMDEGPGSDASKEQEPFINQQDSTSSTRRPLDFR